MGLDMYLRAKKWVPGSDFTREDGEFKTIPVPQFDLIAETVGLTREDVRQDLPSVTLDFTIGYWRKANAIHNWFVNNCANGEDDCKPVWVSRESLEQLLDLVDTVLKSHSEEVARKLLPPEQGFFFGSYEIDDWYWEDMENTKNLLTTILQNEKFAGWDFEYEASW